MWPLISSGARMINERRAWPRTFVLDEEVAAAARLLPGWCVRIIDLSLGGALVETECRLLPGAVVELQLAGSGAAQRVRGRVIRSQVAALDSQQGIRYRGALMFDRQLDFGRIPCGQDG